MIDSRKRGNQGNVGFSSIFINCTPSHWRWGRGIRDGENERERERERGGKGGERMRAKRKRWWYKEKEEIKQIGTRGREKKLGGG